MTKEVIEELDYIIKLLTETAGNGSFSITNEDKPLDRNFKMMNRGYLEIALNNIISAKDYINDKITKTSFSYEWFRSVYEYRDYYCLVDAIRLAIFKLTLMNFEELERYFHIYVPDEETKKEVLLKSYLEFGNQDNLNLVEITENKKLLGCICKVHYEDIASIFNEKYSPYKIKISFVNLEEYRYYPNIQGLINNIEKNLIEKNVSLVIAYENPVSKLGHTGIIKEIRSNEFIFIDTLINRDENLSIKAYNTFDLFGEENRYFVLKIESLN